jgi:hypothetical protein
MTVRVGLAPDSSRLFSVPSASSVDLCVNSFFVFFPLSTLDRKLPHPLLFALFSAHLC